MPLITADITIPPLTLKENPIRVEVRVPAGVIRKVWVLIPAGHKALAHLIIKHGATQIIPFEGDIHGDNEPLEFDEVYELRTEDKLILEGWNEDDTYPHSFFIRLLILPKLFAYPEVTFALALRKMLEVMGIE
jgi:hypothetical protein